MDLTLPPSHAPVWGRCAGSRTIIAQVPPRESQAAREGTAAHWVAASILAAYSSPGHPIPTDTSFVGKPDPRGAIVTQEMYDGAMVYVMDVLQHCNQFGGLNDLNIEVALVAHRIHPRVAGPADCWWFDAKLRRLIIWDFKYGHAFVDPTWAYQFVCYYAAIADHLKIDGHQDQQLQVEFRVVMPRCFTGGDPVQIFSFVASDARNHVNILRGKAEEALGANPQLAPGEHCAMCDGAHLCPAARKVSMLAADFMQRAMPDTLTADGLSFELGMMRWLRKIADAREKALETEATARISAGEFVQGFVVEPKLANRSFIQDATTVINTAKMLYDVDLSLANEVCTPSEAERRLKVLGLPPDVIAGMTERKSLPPKLVPAKDSKAKLIFN